MGKLQFELNYSFDRLCFYEYNGDIRHPLHFVFSTSEDITMFCGSFDEFKNAFEYESCDRIYVDRNGKEYKVYLITLYLKGVKFINVPVIVMNYKNYEYRYELRLSHTLFYDLSFEISNETLTVDTCGLDEVEYLNDGSGYLCGAIDSVIGGCI